MNTFAISVGSGFCFGIGFILACAVMKVLFNMSIT